LIKHSQSASHIEKASSQNFQETTQNSRDSLSRKDNVKRAELNLADFVAEHNIFRPRIT